MNALAELEAELDSRQIHVRLRKNRATEKVEVIGGDYSERLIAKSELRRLGFEPEELTF